MSFPQQYAHTFLFACPECKLPVSAARVSNEKAPETSDALKLNITCHYCQSPVQVLAATAKKHSVDAW
jgi:hypothetical protein